LIRLRFTGPAQRRSNKARERDVAQNCGHAVAGIFAAAGDLRYALGKFHRNVLLEKIRFPNGTFPPEEN